VDIAVYAFTAEVDGSRLRSRLRREAAVRNISLGDSFGLPKAWGAPQARQFAKLCRGTGLPEALRSMEAASELAGRLLDSAIRGEADGLRWNPEAREWG
jgi:hypothetical protein